MHSEMRKNIIFSLDYGPIKRGLPRFSRERYLLDLRPDWTVTTGLWEYRLGTCINNFPYTVPYLAGTNYIQYDMVRYRYSHTGTDILAG
jgi:hypothetical protein